MTPSKPVQITFRIPGAWAGFSELFERLPREFRLTENGLLMPDGSLIEAYPVPPDDQFSNVFFKACRQPPTSQERGTVKRYSANMIMVGEGGSIKLAYRMMQAATAILNAGGAGVFIDNSALAHGATNWKMMTDDGGSDAVSFAFVSVIRNNKHLKTLGMHLLGYPELELTNEGDSDCEESLISLLRYVCRGEKPVGHGHVILDENGLCFRTAKSTETRFDPGSPMHNPFGHLKLTRTNKIAENN